jgi:hypothetical protein
MRQPPQHLANEPAESAPAKEAPSTTGIPNEDEFLTRSLLRARWKCSDSTIKRREKCGLKATHLGGRTVRYRLADVVAFEQGT